MKVLVQMLRRVIPFVITFIVFYSFLSVFDNLSSTRYDYFTEDPVFHCVVKCNQLSLRAANFTKYTLRDDHRESTCDARSTSRGPSQKVVSFSYYGSMNSKRTYFKGIENNVELVRKLYPSWLMRVYHNIKSIQEQQILCRLQCEYYDTLDTCHVDDLPGYGDISASQPNMWRFLALSDPLVDVMISRDLDSNLTAREVAAVSEWLNSTAQLHIMRDHPFHGKAIMAGMWGVRLTGDRKLWRKTTEQMLQYGKTAGKKGQDQEILVKHVWPLAKRKGLTMQHDSYTCRQFRAGTMNGYPTQRLRKVPYNFVGARLHVDSKPLDKVCPKQCRRVVQWDRC